MIYVLIPVKDRIEYTLKCIDSFKRQTLKDITIIVIDDGSIDGTQTKIKSLYQDVVVLTGNGNLWCMGAFAMGVDYVKPLFREGDYIITQNQDTFFESDFVEQLIQVSKKINNSIVGSINYSHKDNSPLYHNHIIKGSVFKPNIIEGELPEIIYDTDTLNTRGTLFPVSVFEKIGNFSPLFPHYAGDYEITCRAKKSGYKLVIASKAICYSWDGNKNLVQKIREKKKKTLKDIWELFTSRRSSANLYYSSLLILLHMPFPYKIFGLIRIYLYSTKIIIFDYLIKSIILGWMI